MRRRPHVAGRLVDGDCPARGSLLVAVGIDLGAGLRLDAGIAG